MSLWLIRTLLTMGGVVSATGLVRAQQPAAPATMRLQAEDLARGFNGAQRNFYFLPPGASGEDYQSAGFFGQKLRPYLAGHAEALGHLDRYRRQKTLFLIERLVTVGAVGLYGQQVLADAGGQQYFNPTQRVAVGVVAVGLLANIFISRNTNRHLQRAVEAYDADVDGGRGSLWRRARPTNLGLSCTPAGRPVLAFGWSLR